VAVVAAIYIAIGFYIHFAVMVAIAALPWTASRQAVQAVKN
jgi:hypothetical protein